MMSQQPIEILQSQKLETKTNEKVIKEDDFMITSKDTSNYFDQMRQMIITEGWTTQDHATLCLLQEMPNAHSFFIVRKVDDLVLGALTIVVTDNFVYGNTYVMRKGFRAAGLGVKLIKAFMYKLRDDLRTKPLIGRAVPAVWKPYVNRPFNVKFFYDVYTCMFSSAQALCDFFPKPVKHNYHLVSVKDIKNYKPWMFKDLIDYDKYVTGQDRTEFLTEFFSIDFVEGVALFDDEWVPKGLTAIAPTGNKDGLYKLNPIFAQSVEDAGLLIQTIAPMARHPNASFVIHVRKHSAGDWILDKYCKTKKPHYVGATVSATNMAKVYKDRSRPELIFAPTNSPAHFDG